MEKQQYIDTNLKALAEKSVIATYTLGSTFILFLTLLDMAVVPELYTRFLVYRLITAGLTVCALVVFIYFRDRIPYAISIFPVMATITVSLMVAGMSYHFGGHESVYYVGFILAAVVCMGGFLVGPLLTLIIGIIVILIYLLPLTYEQITNTSIFWNNTIFLATFIMIFSILKYLAWNLLISKYSLEYDLIQDNERLEEVVRERTRQLYQSQKLESLGILAGGLAHNFNNILSTIKGFADMILLKKDIPEELKEDVKIVDSEVSKGTAIVRNLLSFGKGAKIEKASVDITRLIEERVNIVRTVIPSSVSISFSRNSDIPEIKGDYNLLDQAITNLILNAKDALPAGGKVNIDTYMSDGYLGSDSEMEQVEGKFIQIRISDTGDGIGSEALGKVFDPFYTTKESSKGSGLGLAVVYGTVKDHGGYIDVESESGKGTTFNIYLPF